MSQVKMVAELMALSARTAPKGRGEDFIVTEVLEGDVLRALSQKMLEFGERTGKELFDRDANNVLNSDAVLLLGLKGAQPLGLNCGACGAEECITCLLYTSDAADE